MAFGIGNEQGTKPFSTKRSVVVVIFPGVFSSAFNAAIIIAIHFAAISTPEDPRVAKSGALNRQHTLTISTPFLAV
jgi:hypothetical protein